MTKDKRTRQQLINDLEARRANNDILIDSNDKLTRRVREAESALLAALADRDDWKAAFKLIMRLVK